MIHNWLAAIGFAFLIYFFGLPTLKNIDDYRNNKLNDEQNLIKMIPYSISFIIALLSLLVLVRIPL